MIQSLIRRIKQNDPTLTFLNLNYQNLGDDVIRALAGALNENSHLLILFLDGNDISDKGARVLGKALARHPSLQQLFLSYNTIGDEGAAHLARALTTNNHLQVLKLANNRIRKGTSLGEALQYNHSLSSLVLDGNELGDMGARELIGALRRNKSLKSLDLRNNQIRDIPALADRLYHTLQVNKWLCYVYLKHKDYHPLGKDWESSSLAYHPASLLLDLNRIGRHSFGGCTLHPAEWARVLGKASKSTRRGHSLLYAVLQSRPDLIANSKLFM